MTQWSLKDAQEHFSEVLTAARQSPQVVTEDDKPSAIVMGLDEYQRLTGKPLPDTHAVEDGKTLIDLLLAIPKGGPDDLFERRERKPRDIDF